MRSVMVISSVPRSLINFRGPLIRDLLHQGVQVHVVAPSLENGSPYRASLERMGCIVHSVPLRRTALNPFKDFITFLSFFIIMLKAKPAAVLSYNIKPVIYGSFAAVFAGVPRRYSIITGVGYSLSKSNIFSPLVWLVRILYRLALLSNKVIFFQNSDDAELFKKLKIVSNDSEIKVVNGSGVDLTYFFPAELKSNPISFLMIARLLKSKGVNEYIQASRELKTAYPAARFYLVGWADENPDALSTSEVKALEQDERIEYLGKLEDVRPAIANSHVYVLPSYREGTPRTVLEAMAMGRPVITTDAPGCRETVQDGVNGFLVPPQDSKSLARAMERFISGPELIPKMGEASLKLVREKYDAHKVNAVMLEGMGFLSSDLELE